MYSPFASPVIHVNMQTMDGRTELFIRFRYNL